MMKDLAQMIGITEVGLSKSLNGNPGLTRLQDIAEALEVNITELFEAPKSDAANISCPNCGYRINLKAE